MPLILKYQEFYMTRDHINLTTELDALVSEGDSRGERYL